MYINAGSLFIELLGINVNQIWIRTQVFSFRKDDLKMLSLVGFDEPVHMDVAMEYRWPVTNLMSFLHIYNVECSTLYCEICFLIKKNHNACTFMFGYRLFKTNNHHKPTLLTTRYDLSPFSSRCHVCFPRRWILSSRSPMKNIHLIQHILFRCPK